MFTHRLFINADIMQEGRAVDLLLEDRMLPEVFLCKTLNPHNPPG